MLHAKLHVELPAELPTPSSVVQGLLPPPPSDGADAAQGRHESQRQLLLDNLTVFERMLGAFADAGFDDVVSVVIDGKPAYLDTHEKIGDVGEALTGAVKSGALGEDYSILRTTFCLVEDGLRILGELRARARGADGKGETTIRVSAREEELDLADGEGPREYAARIREYVRNPDRVLAHRDTVEALVAKLAKTIPARLAGSRVSVEPVIIRIVAPGPRQVGRLRHLAFKDARPRTVSSALPSYERTGAYDDPLTFHYYSPCQDLFDWIALGEVLAGHWSSSDVHVVHPTGRVLLRGDEGRSFDASSLDVARDAVRVNSEGRLVVDDRIPPVEALHEDVVGPHSPGWGGEQWAESDG